MESSDDSIRFFTNPSMDNEGDGGSILVSTRGSILVSDEVGMMNGVGFGFRACFGFEGTPNFGVSLCTAPTIDFGARKVVPPEETPQFRPYIGVVNPDLGLSFTINTRPKHRKEFYKWLRIMPSVSLDTGYQLDPDGHFVLVPRAGISFSWQGKSSNEPYF